MTARACADPPLSFLIAPLAAVAQILIRQLDDSVVEILRARAQCRGVSLEQSLRELLTAAAQSQISQRDRLQELRSQTPAAGRSLDVAALIQEDREQR